MTNVISAKEKWKAMSTVFEFAAGSTTFLSQVSSQAGESDAILPDTLFCCVLIVCNALSKNRIYSGLNAPGPPKFRQNTGNIIRNNLYAFVL